MEEFVPKIICFSCNFGWGYLPDRDTLAPEIENWVPVTCIAKVDSAYILEAFEKEADGVLILGCPEGHCHFEDGNFRTEKKVYLLKRVLEAYGIERERVKMIFSSDPDGSKIPELVNEMKGDLIKLGPMKRD